MTTIPRQAPNDPDVVPPGPGQGRAGHRDPAGRTARYWLLTIPELAWHPERGLGGHCVWILGQLEQGVGENAYRHWQLVAGFNQPVRLSAVKQLFGQQVHAEPTRSRAAEAYVVKDDTAVPDTRFELGRRPIQRNDPADWDRVWDLAAANALTDIPADIRVRHYGNLRRIASDYVPSPAIVRSVYVFWGPTGVGKSRRAWEMAGLDGFPKDPRTKFWDGYSGQRSVIIDEFRGGIDVAHILRWTDRYPVRVEIKGGSVPLLADTLIFTSNLSPGSWYPELDAATFAALERRLIIEHME